MATPNSVTQGESGPLVYAAVVSGSPVVTYNHATNQPVTQNTSGFLNVNLSASQVLGTGTIAAPSTQIVSVQVPRVAAATKTSVVSTGGSSVTLVAANVSRLGLIVYNDDANPAFINFGSTATTAIGGYTVKIPSGGTYIMDNPVFTGQVNVIWSAAGSSGVNVTEL